MLTWNVQRASRVRGARQAAWLASCPDADVVTVTEVASGPAGDELAKALAGYGYATHLTDAAGSDYRVLIAARVGDLAPALELRTDHLPHRLAVATVTLPGPRCLAVVGLYVPSRGPRERRNVAKRAFQAAVADLLPILPSTFGPHVPVVVAGDLNVVEPGHVPHHGVFGRWEYDFYRAFAASGFTDAFRHRRPQAVDHSWFGRSGAGYRFDHIFCTSPHRDTLGDCYYLHQPRVSRLSDHAALVVRLTPPPMPPASMTPQPLR
ncbi:endonuclease/exonuclease/phosphatase family protein [Parafrankia discariae]|uniref:endonuclease/exonuclease/phosphatase family protein n=1 Tax=Parafrankia discariae TaxID=365528 RepID=UPI0003623A02|nr:endonuclease/exonuclease/phosphatase family protein [Parafrankia discariae]